MAVYAVSDLHGQYSLWKAIKEYLKEDDILYYLGDAIDRGPQGWDIFTELLDDPRVIYIKGNHEDLMYYSYCSTGPIGSKYFKLWKKNGAQETLDNIAEKNLTVEQKLNYLEKIYDLPTCLTYKNSKGQIFFLSHAGITPNKNYIDMDEFDRMYYEMENRKHFLDEWPKNMEDIFIIHGHTPVQLLRKVFPDNDSFPLVYCDGHKINLDSAAFESGIVALYNLDTNSTEMFFKEI